jgi:hypothetical protein
MEMGDCRSKTGNFRSPQPKMKSSKAAAQAIMRAATNAMRFFVKKNISASASARKKTRMTGTAGSRKSEKVILKVIIAICRADASVIVELACDEPVGIKVNFHGAKPYLEESAVEKNFPLWRGIMTNETWRTQHPADLISFHTVRNCLESSPRSCMSVTKMYAQDYHVQQKEQSRRNRPAHFHRSVDCWKTVGPVLIFN